MGTAAEAIKLQQEQLELFVDRHLIQRTSGVELRLNRPTDRGPVMTFDAPWEGSYVAYITVFKDGPIYRMYYRGKPELTPTGDKNEVTCYAESTDGIQWHRPVLRLFEVRELVTTTSFSIAVFHRFLQISAPSWTLGRAFPRPKNTKRSVGGSMVK